MECKETEEHPVKLQAGQLKNTAESAPTAVRPKYNNRNTEEQKCAPSVLSPLKYRPNDTNCIT
jgi:hypothetical protein